jgi:hypothetical protein
MSCVVVSLGSGTEHRPNLSAMRLSRVVLGDPEPDADHRHGLFFEIPHQHGIAVRCVQIMHGVVQNRTQFLPGRIGVLDCEQLVHGVGFLFAGATTLFGPAHLGRLEPR